MQKLISTRRVISHLLIHHRLRKLHRSVVGEATTDRMGTPKTTVGGSKIATIGLKKASATRGMIAPTSMMPNGKAS